MTDIASLIVRIGADASRLQSELGATERSIAGFSRSSIQSLSAIGQKITLLSAPLAGIGAMAAKAAISFESEFANVVKTVDATDAELAALRKGIRELAVSDSPVAGLENSLQNITQVAAAAGQLGIATPDILGFSEIMTALGVATDYTAEEAAVMAARFANITGMKASEYINFGDALVTLGNNVAATESEIGSFALRLSTLSTYKWRPDAILGYSAALAGLGVSAELGGTNINKSVADMTKALALGGAELQGYAKIAGLSADEFKKLGAADSAGAFTKFIEGLGKLSAEEQLIQLNDLGITSTEMIGVLQKLASGYGTLTDALDLSAEGWAGNGAAMAEAAAKANTTQGSINRMLNQINELRITAGETLLPVINRVAERLVPVIAGFTAWVSENSALVGQIFVLATAASGLGGALVIVGPALSAIGTALALVLSPIGLATAAIWGLSRAWEANVGGIRTGAVMISGRLNTLGQVLAARVNDIQIGGQSIGTIAAGISGDLSSAIGAAIERIETERVFARMGIRMAREMDKAIAWVERISFPSLAPAGLVLPELDLAGVQAWATSNADSIRDALITAAGIVFGGPIGLASAIYKAIQSDFLGIGTALTSSGIPAAIEGVFNEIRRIFGDVISVVFDGGLAESSLLDRISNDVSNALSIVKDVAEDIGENIGAGIRGLGDGLGRFFDAIRNIDGDKLYSIIRPLGAVLGGIAINAALLASAGVKLVLEGLGDALALLGEGASQLVDFGAALMNGNIGQAISNLGAPGVIAAAVAAAAAIPALATGLGLLKAAVSGLVSSSLAKIALALGGLAVLQEGIDTDNLALIAGGLAAIGAAAWLAAGPFGLLVAGIGGLAVLIQELGPGIIESWGSVFAQFPSVVSIMIDDLKMRLRIAGDDIRAFFERIFLGIEGFFLGIIAEISNRLFAVTITNDRFNIIPDFAMDDGIDRRLQEVRDRLSAFNLADTLRGALRPGEVRALLEETSIIYRDGIEDIWNPALVGQLVAANSAGLRAALATALLDALSTGNVDEIKILTKLSIDLGVDSPAVAGKMVDILHRTLDHIGVSIQSQITANPRVANIESVINNVRNTLSSIPVSATINAFLSVNPVLSTIGNVARNIGMALGINGSHADGLPYVPFDGYIAQLHKGERVLTAAESRNYGNGGGDGAGGIVFQPGAVVIYAGAGANGTQIADDFERRIGQAYRARGIR